MKSIFHPDQYERVDLPQIVARIKSDKDLFAEIYKIRGTKDKAERDNLKKSLPAFALGEHDGTIKPSTRISTKWFIYDIDGLDQNKINQLSRGEEGLINKFCVFAFRTPSNNGIKFIIELEKPVDASNYKHNYMHYLSYFEDLLKVDIDKAYNAAQTFYSYDAECKINPHYTKFPVYSIVEESVAKDFDEYNYHNDEIVDVMDHLATKKLSYAEWVSVCLALKHVDGGKELFMKLAGQDTSVGDSERKWEGCGTPKAIKLGTLYYIARKHGYIRKDIYCNSTIGRKCPFEIRKDGWWYVKDNKNLHAYGWKEIKMLYEIITPNGETKTILEIDNKQITIPKSSLRSLSSFAGEVLKVPGLVYLSQNAVFYNMVIEYLDKTKTGTILTHCSGFGRVLPTVWNLGNTALVNGTLMPFDNIILTGEETGYLLDDAPAIRINPSKQFFPKLHSMFEFYGNRAAIALGWAYSNVYFSESKGNGFPILFIHGKTASGKTQLGHVILSLFGVHSPATDELKINMTDTTTVAMNRVKAGAKAIPHLFDEYGKGNDRVKIEHQLKLKSLFDASSRTRAFKDQSTNVEKLEVNSGTIMTACYREVDPECVNRCVYINMDGAKSGKNSRDWALSFQGKAAHDLSGFILISAAKTNYPLWLRNYEDCFDTLAKTGADSRVCENYAKVWAGYMTFCEVVQEGMKKKIIDANEDDVMPTVEPEYWAEQVMKVCQFGIETEPLVIFLQTIAAMASQDKYSYFIAIEEGKHDTDRQQMVDYIWFRNQQDMAIIEVKKYNPRIADSIQFTGKQLPYMIKTHSTYVSSGVKYFRTPTGGGNYRAYCIAVPSEADSPTEKTVEPPAVHQPIEDQSNIPF